MSVVIARHAMHVLALVIFGHTFRNKRFSYWL